MKEQFVSYKIALKLKELDFDEEFNLFGNTVYFVNSQFSICNEEYKKLFPEKEYVLAPLWQQAIDWLREKHEIWIFVDLAYDFSSYSPRMYKKGKTEFSFHGNEYNNYYEAREQAILKALELISKTK